MRTTAADADLDLLTLEEAAASLPTLPSAGTLRRWIGKGFPVGNGRSVRLRALRVGKRVMVRRGALARFFQEIEAKAGEVSTVG